VAVTTSRAQKKKLKKKSTEKKDRRKRKPVSAHNRRPHDLAKERRHARIHIRVPPQPTYAVAEDHKKIKAKKNYRRTSGFHRSQNVWRSEAQDKN